MMDNNAPPQYNQGAPGYGQPGVQVQQPQYGNQPMQQPTYAQQPPVQQGYAPPVQQGYNQPQNTYGQQPPVQQGFAQPQYQQQQPAMGMATTAPTGGPAPGGGSLPLQHNWKADLCDCCKCERCNVCLYAWCCNCCAIADIHVSTNPDPSKWWGIVITLTILNILANTLGRVAGIVAFLCWLAAWVMGFYLLMTAGDLVKRRFNITTGNECIIVFCCAPCYTCQIMSEITYQLNRQDQPACDMAKPIAKEMIDNIQKASPCCAPGMLNVQL